MVFILRKRKVSSEGLEPRFLCAGTMLCRINIERNLIICLFVFLRRLISINRRYDTACIVPFCEGTDDVKCKKGSW